MIYIYWIYRILLNIKKHRNSIVTKDLRGFENLKRDTKLCNKRWSKLLPDSPRSRNYSERSCVAETAHDKPIKSVRDFTIFSRTSIYDIQVSTFPRRSFPFLFRRDRPEFYYRTKLRRTRCVEHSDVAHWLSKVASCLCTLKLTSSLQAEDKQARRAQALWCKVGASDIGRL